MEWWANLSGAVQGFFMAAAFFSVIFLWQFIASLIGLGGEEMDADIDADIDADMDMDLDELEAHSLEEAGESVAAFKVLSIRAVLAFCTLFCWAAGLYLNTGKSVNTALLYAIAWGVAGWLLVSLLVNWLRRLAETGTARLATCVGTSGNVYLDIPASGRGEVRVTVSGVVSMVKARGADAVEIKAGTPIQVVRTLGSTTVEVRPDESGQETKGTEE